MLVSGHVTRHITLTARIFTLLDEDNSKIMDMYILKYCCQTQTGDLSLRYLNCIRATEWNCTSDILPIKHCTL